MKNINKKKAIIIGASSGIGLALARLLSEEGYVTGLAARRLDLLKKISKEMPGQCFIKKMDVTDHKGAGKALNALIDEMGGVDLVIISAGTGHLNPKLSYEKEISTIEVNVSGFVVIADIMMNYFIKRGGGHIVGLSSIAALTGDILAPSYSASKAFVSNYMKGLRFKSVKEKLNITVTDIQPGFVDTAMAKGGGLFWVAPPEKAAGQIYSAIKNKRSHAYITRRWRIIAWFFKISPEWLTARVQ